MKGKCLIFKIMVWKVGVFVEIVKFGGYGICDNVVRIVIFDQVIDNVKIIGKVMLNMFYIMKLNILDMRGVGIYVNQLVLINLNFFICFSCLLVQLSYFFGGLYFVCDIF